MRGLVATVAALGMLAGHAAANDTSAQLTTGGLVFVKNEDVRMVSEELFISREEIRVVYEFENISDRDSQVLVAFPMPDIDNNPWTLVSLPAPDQDNPFAFETSFNGQPVEAELHQYAYAAGVDRTEVLHALGIPLSGHLMSTWNVIHALPEKTVAELFQLGLVVPDQYADAAGDWTVQHYPYWTTRSTYTWEALFPAGETVTVEHRYTPSVGGTTGVTFMWEDDTYAHSTRAEYELRYCMEDNFVAAVERTMTPGEPWSAPFFENWISYVLSTGANWAGPIEHFRLVVDKGAPENLVSFCWDGPVTRLDDTSFEAVMEDFYPQGDLDILILERHEGWD